MISELSFTEAKIVLYGISGLRLSANIFKIPPVCGPPLLVNSFIRFSNFCCRRLRITASGFEIVLVKLLSGSSLYTWSANNFSSLRFFNCSFRFFFKSFFSLLDSLRFNCPSSWFTSKNFAGWIFKSALFRTKRPSRSSLCHNNWTSNGYSERPNFRTSKKKTRHYYITWNTHQAICIKIHIKQYIKKHMQYTSSNTHTLKKHMQYTSSNVH